MHPERAADILEEMDPDEAADLLGDMDDKSSEQLLNLMEDEDEEDVRQLLAYPEDSAGGIMTTEFAHIPDNYTVEAALSYLRSNEDALEDEFMFYVYILDEKERLKVVVILRDLVTAPFNSPVSKWFDDDPAVVDPLVSQEETAYLVAKYNLMAIPVVDSDTHKMLGIVTVDDALDTVLPTAWKKKLPALLPDRRLFVHRKNQDSTLARKNPDLLCIIGPGQITASADKMMPPAFATYSMSGYP